MEYAVIETGGKQYTVHPGDIIKVDKLEAPENGAIDLQKVLMIDKDGSYNLGKPLVEGAIVKAEVAETGRHPKILVFKYKNKIRYRRLVGHRQPYTALKITEIIESSAKAPTARRRRTTKKVEDGA